MEIKGNKMRFETRNRKSPPSRQFNNNSRVPACGTIRSWRERKRGQVSATLFGDYKNLPRFLRQERAKSGRAGYDINRHIRLVLWHKEQAAQ